MDLKVVQFLETKDKYRKKTETYLIKEMEMEHKVNVFS
jgi:hypothetical protein